MFFILKKLIVKLVNCGDKTASVEKFSDWVSQPGSHQAPRLVEVFLCKFHCHESIFDELLWRIHKK